VRETLPWPRERGVDPVGRARMVWTSGGPLTVGDALSEAAQGMLREAEAEFGRQFGGTEGEAGAGPVVRCFAPGRVNLIGEHTDYTGGFVLPFAIDLVTVVVARAAPPGRKESRVVSVNRASDGVDAFDASEADASRVAALPRWSRYVKGVCCVYAQAGEPAPAFDAVFSSSVPLGGGLSSSASLEVATGALVEALRGVERWPEAAQVERALRAQRAEHEFAGVPCGIMDQLVSSTGRPHCVLKLDCRSRACEPVAMDPGAGVAFVVVNSNVTHDLGAGAYEQRVAECARATEAVRGVAGGEGVKELRDADLAMVEAAEAAMGDPVAYRRALHVVTENARVHACADALASGDFATAGRLMKESHASLRDRFEVSCAELDALVDIAVAVPGVYGSRMTGGGFGGCTITLCDAQAVPALTEAIQAQYKVRTGCDPTIFTTAPGPGAARLV